MPAVTFEHLGLIDYKKAWDYQEALLADGIAKKIQNRDLPADNQHPIANRLLFCEHPHVYTLGKSGDQSNLLITDTFLKNIGASFYHINRGGDITYHGPGQLVAYPIFDLEQFATDINIYLRNLEEAIILTLADYGIEAGRYPKYTGVWLDADKPHLARKICAIGVKTSRWITMHGLAFNVNSDLSYFSHIVPCGIENAGVTSLQKELGKAINLKEVENKLQANFALVFGYSYISE